MTALDIQERNDLTMNLEELVARFAENAGLENRPPSEGVWKFSADNNVFGVTSDETGNIVWLFGEIPYAVPERKDDLIKAAMEANYFRRGTGGATFSLNPDTGALTLAASKRLDALDEESFYAFVERFVNALAVWNDISSAAGTSGKEPAEPAEYASDFMFTRI